MALDKVGLMAVIEGMPAFEAAGRTIDSTYDRLGGSSEKAAGRMSRMGDIAKTAIGFAVGTVAVQAMQGFAREVGQMLLTTGPAMVDMENSFKRLSASYQLNSQTMIDSMRAASKGTISDAKLIESANKALVGSGQALGKQWGQDLPKLLEIARASAKATGQDVGFLFESLVTGIKRGSPMIIDNTGLQLKLGEAVEAMAKKVGKSVEELTAEERQIALLNATVEAGAGLVASLGEEGLTAAEKIAVLRARVDNFRDRLVMGLVPILTRVLDKVIVLFDWLGVQAPKALQTLIALFGRLQTALANLLPATVLEKLRFFRELMRSIFDIPMLVREYDLESALLNIEATFDTYFGEDSKIRKAAYLLLQLFRDMVDFGRLAREYGLESGIRNIEATLTTYFGEDTRIGRAISFTAQLLVDLVDLKRLVQEYGFESGVRNIEATLLTYFGENAKAAKAIEFTSQLLIDLVDIKRLTEEYGFESAVLNIASTFDTYLGPDSIATKAVYALADAIPLINERLVEAEEKVRAFFDAHREEWPKLEGVAKPALIAVGGYLLVHFLGPLGAAILVVRTLKEAWDRDFLGIRESLGPFVEEVKAKVGEFTGSVQGFYTNLLASFFGLRDELIGGWQVIAANISGSIGTMSTALSALGLWWRNFWTVALTAWQNFWSGFSPAANIATRMVERFVSEQYLPRLERLSRQFWQTLDAVFESLQRVNATFQDMLNRHPHVRRALEIVIELVARLVSAALLPALYHFLNIINMALMTLEGVLKGVELAFRGFAFVMEGWFKVADVFLGVLDDVLAGLQNLWNFLQRSFTLNIRWPSPPAWLSNLVPGFQHGGVVPGPLGSPQLVMAHGGERFLGAPVVNNYNYSSSWSPTVNANYPQQSGMSVRRDLETLAVLYRMR